jgi:putative glycosyl hydrolase
MRKKIAIGIAFVVVLGLSSALFLSDGDSYSALMRRFKGSVRTIQTIQHANPDILSSMSEPFGINISTMGDLLLFDPNYDFDEELDIQMNSLEYLGVSWARLWIDWAGVEHCGKGSAEDPDTISQGKGYQPFDRYVEGLEEREISYYISLNFAPNWACEYENPAPEDFFCAFPIDESYGNWTDKHLWACDVPLFDPDDWYDFVYETVDRYKDNTKYFGLGNEPDVSYFFKGPPEEYRDMMLIPGARAVKDACPECFVVGPEFVKLAEPEKLKRIFDDGGWEAIDIVALHSYKVYEADENFARIMAAYDEVLAGRESKPLWITEVGKDWDRFTDDEIVEFYEEMTSIALADGSPVRKLFFYASGFWDFQDIWSIFDTSQTEMWNGKTIHKPRPAAEAYKEIIENWGKVETPAVKARVKAIFK